MQMHLRERLFLCFALVTVLLGTVTTLVGVRFSGKAIEREAQTRVEADLRITRLFLNKALVRVQESLGQVQNHAEILALARSGRLGEAQVSLEKARVSAGLDFLTLTDQKGTVLARPQPPYASGDDLSIDPVVAQGLQEKQTRAATEILAQERLQREAKTLALKAYMSFEPTARAKPRPELEETAGMALEAFLPIVDNEGNLVGGLVGGLLLNRNFEVVDEVKDLVFREEKHRGKDVGTVTIFQWDLRISTNVTQASGNRAIGTRVSKEVYDRVLENGLPWYGRAFVVNDWYITAYEPIRNSRDKIIGMLYVGILAQEYDEQKDRLTTLLLALTSGAVALVIVLSFFLARGLSRPLQRLAEGTQVISKGKLDWRVPEIGRIPEVTNLTQAFNAMAATLQERGQQLRKQHEELAKANQKLRETNDNYMKTLRFITHELKSPLAAIQSMIDVLVADLLGDLPDKSRHFLVRIKRNCEELQDMVRNYLDLARAERGELVATKSPIDLMKDVVAPVVTQTQPLFKSRQVNLVVSCPERLTLEADAELLRIALGNYLSNAAKYGKEEGQARLEVATDGVEVTIAVWNEGRGFSEEEGKTLFNKFSRLRNTDTRDKRGSGLSLFICREILDLHNGRVLAESQPGQWARFSLRLPITAHSVSGVGPGQKD